MRQIWRQCWPHGCSTPNNSHVSLFRVDPRHSLSVLSLGLRSSSASSCPWRACSEYNGVKRIIFHCFFLSNTQIYTSKLAEIGAKASIDRWVICSGRDPFARWAVRIRDHGSKAHAHRCHVRAYDRRPGRRRRRRRTASRSHIRRDFSGDPT